MNNLWILTEEMPKHEVIMAILKKLADDGNFSVKLDTLKILPIIENNLFTSLYEVTGASSEGFRRIFISIISGDSSFVDFLIFLKKEKPNNNDIPLYAIEETKTTDAESRNTGVYQRCSKFVYVDFFYPGIKKIMLYNLLTPENKKPTATNVFGTRMLRAIEVEIIGKEIDDKLMVPFQNIDELVDFKKTMRKPPKGNVPIEIIVESDAIKVSGRLYNQTGLDYDPNIGALSIIAQCIRKWEKKKPIIITRHGLEQKHVGRDNKFIQIANKLNIQLAGLTVPKVNTKPNYWHYETTQEKLGTIFLHVALLEYTNSLIVYSNHGGTERSYFIYPDGKPVAIEKYQEGRKEEYKAGNKKAIIYLPDLIIYDVDRKEIINVEGKKYSTRKKGIAELKNYDYIEDKMIKPSYKPKSIVRTVVIAGDKKESIEEKEIGFYLNEKGAMILGPNAPEIFKVVIDKLLASQ
ncbi:MAG: hypothetical protein HOC78_03800 [Candidatus Komeilibacteria bacterium]|nr:hypothetical protein [Candidatus Komeilibacteria bacterium]